MHKSAESHDRASARTPTPVSSFRTPEPGLPTAGVCSVPSLRPPSLRTSPVQKVTPSCLRWPRGGRRECREPEKDLPPQVNPTRAARPLTDRLDAAQRLCAVDKSARTNAPSHDPGPRAPRLEKWGRTRHRHGARRTPRHGRRAAPGTALLRAACGAGVGVTRAVKKYCTAPENNLLTYIPALCTLCARTHTHTTRTHAQTRGGRPGQ